jgi:DNA-nicking Smr family endonuclease
MRRLSPEERALWGQVAGTVRRVNPSHSVRTEPVEVLVQRIAVLTAPKASTSSARTASSAARTALVLPRASHQNTLDGSWDKRITKGALEPDFTIDLHGETLSSAHARLNRSLAAAVRQQARIILLITGKPAVDNPRLPPTSRGVIRASVKDWIAASSYAGHIAAIRGAHPRHGGAGALYLILRRVRS